MVVVGITGAAMVVADIFNGCRDYRLRGQWTTLGVIGPVEVGADL